MRDQVILSKPGLRMASHGTRRGLLRAGSLSPDLNKTTKIFLFFLPDTPRAGNAHEIDSQAARGKNTIVRSSRLSLCDSFLVCRRPDRLFTTLGNLRGRLGRSMRHRPIGPGQWLALFGDCLARISAVGSVEARSLRHSLLPQNSMTTQAHRKSLHLRP